MDKVIILIHAFTWLDQRLLERMFPAYEELFYFDGEGKESGQKVDG